jgi:hypothetical protein
MAAVSNNEEFLWRSNDSAGPIRLSFFFLLRLVGLSIEHSEIVIAVFVQR